MVLVHHATLSQNFCNFYVNKLLTASIAASVIGTISLFVYVQTLEPKQISISAVDMVGQGVLIKISGTVQTVEPKEKQIFFKLCEISCISVHSPKNLKPLIMNGDRFSVVGITKDFYGNAYIEAKKIIEPE